MEALGNLSKKYMSLHIFIIKLHAQDLESKFLKFEIDYIAFGIPMPKSSTWTRFCCIFLCFYALGNGILINDSTRDFFY